MRARERELQQQEWADSQVRANSIMSAGLSSLGMGITSGASNLYASALANQAQGIYVSERQHLIAVNQLREEIAILKLEIAKNKETKMVGFFSTKKTRMKIEEMQHKHRLEVAELRAQIEREKKHWEEDKKRLQEKLKADSEIALKEAISLTKLQSEQQIKQAQLDADRKLNQEIAKLNKEHYDKLSESMSKLHEEGNVTTRFMQELSLKMFEKAPKNTVRTEVLTGALNGGSEDNETLP